MNDAAVSRIGGGVTPDRKQYETVDLAALITNEVPREWFAEAVANAKQAAESPAMNTQRREAVVLRLMHDLHVPEHLGRLLCELAVIFLKHEGRYGRA